jgi:hypothetical protein
MVVVQEHTVKPAFSQRFRISFEGDAHCAVAHGEKVTPDTVIFEGRTSEILQSINLSKELGVTARETGKFVTIEDGEIVDVGDIIARRSVAMGTVERIVRARTEGRVMLENIQGGFAEIRAPFNEATVTAGVHGRVGRIYPERMGRRVVDLEVAGYVSHPFFCIGESVSGELFIIKEGNSLYRPGDVDGRCKGKIVVAGRSLSVALYESLAEYGARGIIVGGMPKTEKETLSEPSIPIFISEGWGIIPINSVLLQVLQEYEGDHVYIDEDNSKLVIAPSDPAKEIGREKGGFFPRVSVIKLEKGMDVQIWDMPYWGYSGKVLDILEDESLVKVMLASGKTLAVPDGVVTAIADT